jgi:starch synthase
MKVLHVSAECYPAAKSGGLGDVVGALPKYLSEIGCPAGVIIPKYSLKWINQHEFKTIYRGTVRLHNQYLPFAIQQEQSNQLGFPLFVADIPGKFDRPGIYADPGGYTYGDEVERYLSFQQAVLQWIVNTPGQPDVMHCHDHHTGLIPFMVKYCPEYQSLSKIPTVFTIHNGAYHGAFGWNNMYLLPFFMSGARGLLDWGNTINPLATAVKSAWRVTTVSSSYLDELKHNSNGMESLLQHEQHKCLGVLNGIDTQVWNPQTDSYIAAKWDDSLSEFKNANKRVIGQHFNLNLNLPLITFIGRLVGEKGADLLPDLINRVLRSGMQVAFAVLGTGQQHIHHGLQQLAHHFPGRFDVALEYNEGLAHQLYAGSDFLLMPSRVEPCGLNQMYAMRYGTLPIVRSVGGLKDTVPDIGEPDGSGRGIRFTHFNLDDAHLAIYRAAEFYHQRRADFEKVREKNTSIDFSWENSAKKYYDIYQEMI